MKKEKPPQTVKSAESLDRAVEPKKSILKSVNSSGRIDLSGLKTEAHKVSFAEVEKKKNAVRKKN